MARIRVGQKRSPIRPATAILLFSLRMPASTAKRGSWGMVSTMSANQVKPESTRPPTKPPSDPRVTAIIVEMAAARNPIVRIGLPPLMT